MHTPVTKRPCGRGGFDYMSSKWPPSMVQASRPPLRARLNRRLLRLVPSTQHSTKSSPDSIWPQPHPSRTPSSPSVLAKASPEAILDWAAFRLPRRSATWSVEWWCFDGTAQIGGYLSPREDVLSHWEDPSPRALPAVEVYRWPPLLWCQALRRPPGCRHGMTNWVRGPEG